MRVRKWALLAVALVAGCIDERGADNLFAEAGPVDEPDAAPALRGPRIAMRPEALELGAVAAGATATASLIVRNTGDADLHVSSMVLNGSALFVAVVNGADPQRRPEVLADPDGDGAPGLAPGESFVVTVRYAPQVGGASVGELVVRSDDAERPEVVVPLRANVGVPCLAVDPDAVSFPGSFLGRPDDREVHLANCGDTPLTLSGLDLDGSPAFALAGAPELPLVLPPAGAATFGVRFTASDLGEHRGTLTVRTAEAAPRTLPLLGRGTENQCPAAMAVESDLVVAPLDVVVLDAGPSRDPDGPGGRPVAYEWVVVTSPEGSVSVPGEALLHPGDPALGVLPDDSSTPTAVFFADLEGAYTLELRVRDNLGLGPAECESAVARVRVAARPPERGLRVELTWRTPNDPDVTDDAGTDLDLHLLHPNAEAWFGAPYDCHFYNPTPDWGRLADPDDDPSLLADDDHRGGPEIIALPEVENTTALGAPYVVGVHYYRSADRRSGFDFGPALARVRVFVNGELAWDFTGEGEPGERQMDAADHFWDVADVQWPSGEVRTRDRYYGARP